MIVTRFHYPIENREIPKLDLLIERVIQKNPKKDAVVLIEGGEGEGKTTKSVQIGYYVSEKTGRVFNHTRMFFDLAKMIEFAQKTDEEIIVWDEPSAQAMSGDSGKKIVRDLFRLLQMCRKKRHFIIINMTYFDKFKDYLVWQRPNCMFHVYSRNEKEAGRFVFVPKKNLEKLWMDWARKKQRNYKKYASKKVRGTFPDVLNPDYRNNVLSDFDYDYYDKEKEAAIRAIGQEPEKEPKVKLKELKLQWKCSKLAKKLGLKMKEVAELLEMSPHILGEWANLPLKYPFLLAE